MFSSEKKGMRDCYERVGLLVVAVDDGDRGRERGSRDCRGGDGGDCIATALSSYTHPQRIRYLLSLYIFS